MKKKYTEFILALVSVLCASALMCGCGIIIVNSPATAETEETEISDVTTSYEVSEHKPHYSDTAVMARRYLKTIPKKDYGGSVFLITSAKAGVAAPDENSGAVISSRLLERNEKVGNYFNLSISTKTAKPEDMLADISANVKSGTYFSDIIFIEQAYIYQFMVRGCLTNLTSMPSLNLNAEYFYTTSAPAAGAAGKTYGVAGPATVTEDSLSCIFFNKALIKTVLEKYLAVYDYADDASTWFGKVKAITEEIGFTTDMKAYKADPTAYKGTVADVSTFLRQAITGKTNSPDLYTVTRILGYERTCERVKKVMASL